MKIDNKIFKQHIYFDLAFDKTYDSKRDKSHKYWLKLNLRIKGFRISQQMLDSLVNYYCYDYNTNCRYCHKSIIKQEACVTSGYWGVGRTFYLCHKDCKQLGEKQEAYECQKIDANCNDCKFLDRKNEWCIKNNNKPILVANNFATNFECFKHRLDI